MATGADPMPGDWFSIDINDNVKNLGRFAVDEHNRKEHTHLEFKKVTNALEQLVAGTNYRLTIEAADGGENKLYEALVFVSLTNVKELEDFKPLLRAQA